MIPGRRLAAVATLSLAVLAAPAACNTKTSTPPSAAPSPSREVPWEGLRTRPLSLPTVAPGQPCPVSPSTRPLDDRILMRGAGPVYNAANDVQAGTLNKVAFFANSSYTGPILVRGKQLNGPNRLLFGWQPEFEGQMLAPADTFTWPTGHVVPLFAEMDLMKTNTTGGGVPATWRSWPSFTYAPTQGCYAWQVDGASFTQIIVFEAT